MRRLLASASIVVVTASSCSSPTPPTTTMPLPLTRFRTEDTAYLSISGYDQATRFVVRDRAGWESAWSQIHARLRPVPPLPDVDFSMQMIAVVGLGGQSTSGYDVVLASASETSGTITVEATSKSPSPRCVTLPVVTSPVDLARLPRREGAVLFQIVGSTSC